MLYLHDEANIEKRPFPKAVKNRPGSPVEEVTSKRSLGLFEQKNQKSVLQTPQKNRPLRSVGHLFPTLQNRYFVLLNFVLC